MTITGESKSRLVELKKYTKSGDFFEQYFLSSSSGSDGVNEDLSDIQSTPQRIVYYVGGITFTDIIAGGESKTIISFEGQGYSSLDFVDLPIIKDPNKSNVVQNPKIDNDVFIVRQQLSVFEKNYKLGEVNGLVDLTSYAGGKFFNIVTNS